MKSGGALAAVALACGLAGCSPTSNAQARGERAVLANLRDPSSAKFTDVTVREVRAAGTTVTSFDICGLVNAKNAFGGYTGNRRFIASSEHNIVLFDLGDGSPNDIFEKNWQERC